MAEGVGEVTDCDTQGTSMTAVLGGSAELVELLAGAESIVLLSRQEMIGAAAAWTETCGGGTRRRKRWISAWRKEGKRGSWLNGMNAGVRGDILVEQRKGQRGQDGPCEI